VEECRSPVRRAVDWLLDGLPDPEWNWTFIQYRVASRNAAPARGLPIADFELVTFTGETVQLSQFRGQPVVINFWGTWCPPCKNEMPLLQSAYEAYQPELVILAVNVNDSRKFGRAICGRNGPYIPHTDG
jgi:cytochrome c biogenesis protein CcmG, thiol:disulfide interchange protein DsbE